MRSYVLTGYIFPDYTWMHAYPNSQRNSRRIVLLNKLRSTEIIPDMDNFYIVTALLGICLNVTANHWSGLVDNNWTWKVHLIWLLVDNTRNSLESWWRKHKKLFNCCWISCQLTNWNISTNPYYVILVEINLSKRVLRRSRVIRNYLY